MPERPAFKISRRRLWLFRIVVPVGLLLLVGGGLELALRLCGFGYPASFFLKTEIGGKDYYVSNDRFGYRFFPPALARTPVPMRMEVKKPANTYRIFVFGESAAMGDPDPTFGAWRYLQVLLHERFPATDFQVVCVAMTAINSHVILPIARECARHDGDLWIIYMGNNEMVGPFGGGTVFGSRVAGIHLIRASLAVKDTKTGHLIDSLAQRWGHSSAPKTWSGLNMFKDHQLRYDDPNRLRAYENFKQNLNDILRAGQDAGVPVILSTVGSNLKDCAPFGSLHSAGLNDIQQSKWDGLYQEGTNFESSSDFPDALKKYEQAAAIDPQYAELNFRSGRCQLALTNFEQALGDFELARDDDTLAFRADSRINRIIEDAAQEKANHGVYFLDARKALAQSSPAKIPGNELFYEHVHLNFDGNYLLGRAYAEQALKVLPKSILAQGKSGWASAELCDRRLAVSPWDRFRVWQDNYSRVSEPPFTDQLNDVPRAKFYMAKLQELNSQMTEQTRAQSRATYKKALTLSPGDYCLRENFAQFCDESGDLAEAPGEEQKVSELLPHNPMTPCIIGRLLVRLGNLDEAEKNFLRALAIRNDYVPALNEMRILLANQQETAEAGKSILPALLKRIPARSKLIKTGDSWSKMREIGTRLSFTTKAPPIISQTDQRTISITLSVWSPGIRATKPSIILTLLSGWTPISGRLDIYSEASWRLKEELMRRRRSFPRLFALVRTSRRGICMMDSPSQSWANWMKRSKSFQITLHLNPTNLTAQQNLQAIQAQKNSQSMKVILLSSPAKDERTAYEQSNLFNWFREWAGVRVSFNISEIAICCLIDQAV